MPPMPSILSLLTVGGSMLLNAASATSSSDELPDGVIHFPLFRQEAAPAELVARKDNYLEDYSDNDVSQFRFMVELVVGKNKQRVSAQLDTGSSDLWLMDDDNPYCQPIVNGTDIIKPKHKHNNVNENWKATCYVVSMLDAKKASFKENKTSFSVVNHGSLIDGYTFVNGTYGQADVSIAGQTIKKANFVLAKETNASMAVWGVGLPGGENLVNHVDKNGKFTPTYSNLPQQMKEQGIIKANAYSLWINQSSYMANGSLLFGGVDHSKYSGELQTVPIVSSRAGVSSPDKLQIMLHGITLEQGSNSAEIVKCSVPALLDSKAEFIMLPDEFLNAITVSMGAAYSNLGNIPIPCDVEGSLIFDFSGINIEIPLRNMTDLTYLNKVNTCTLQLRSGGDSVILGEKFMKWIYAVYDLDNKEISLAESLQNATKSSIEAISSSVPSATAASSYSSTDIQDSISTTHATFFSNSMTSSASGAPSTAIAYSALSTEAISSGNSFTGVSTESPLKSGTANKKDSKGNGAPSVQRQSVLGALLSGMCGLILAI